MPATTPNLWFDTQALEAAEFYVSVFPNSRVVDVLHYGPSGGDREGTVMTVDFELDGTRFTGINGGPQFSFDEAVSFLIPCADQAEVDHYWDALTAGGKEGPCGWLSDRYGRAGQVAPTRLEALLRDPDPARVERATAAMLGTHGKFDVAALERAADGEA